MTARRGSLVLTLAVAAAMRVPALESAIVWFSGEKVVLDLRYAAVPVFLTTAHLPFLQLLNQGGNPQRTEGEPR